MSDLSISSLFSVKGQVAVVTGGGSGIGTMIATTLVQNGAKVYISSRKEKQLREVSDALNKMGPGRCHYFVTDLSSKAGCDALAAHIISKESKIHILVNNSGATWGGPYDNFPEKEGWDRIMSLNVKSIFYLTSALTPLLTKEASNTSPGRVINISSVAGLSPIVVSELSAPGNGVFSYNVSKAAVNHLTSIMAVTLGPQNVTCNAILPGVFPSKMTAFGLTKHHDSFVRNQPTGRVGMPQDMAGTVLFLVSPAGAHVTGAQIALDGGALLGRGSSLPDKAKL